MAGSHHGQAIPTHLGLELFEQFVFAPFRGQPWSGTEAGFVQDLQLCSATALYGAVSGSSCRSIGMAKAVRRSTTPASIALGGGGRPMAASTPSLRARC